MRRFFIDKNNIGKEGLFITGDEAHHIKDVIRLKPGDEFIGFDAEGFQYGCRIHAMSKNKIEAIIKRKYKAAVTIPDVTLACAIPKASKMDYIMQKASELGIKKIIPMQTKRTQVRLDIARAKAKINRWEKIAKESAKQCGRSGVLVIEQVKSFEIVIKEAAAYKTKLAPYLGGSTKYISDALDNYRLNSVICLIGPEGDFTKDEAANAVKAGFMPVSLGPLVMKVDTAAVFVMSLIMNKFYNQ